MPKLVQPADGACLFVCFVIFACGLGPLRARAAEAPQGETDVAPLIVSANPLPTPATQVASSVTLITAKDMEAKQARTLVDALVDTPGLNLVQNGGPGGVASVFIRGTDSNHAKVVVDGIDVSDPSAPSGAFDFANLLTAGLDRVEVLRGPQSGLYGSDAIGGVVDIVTKSGAGPVRFDVSAEAGTFATFDQAAAASGSAGLVSYRFDVAHVHVGATPVTPIDLLAPGEDRHDDSYDNITLATKLGLALTGRTDLGLVARYVVTDLHFTADDNFGLFPDPVQSENRAKALFARATVHQSLFDDRFDQTVGVGFTSYRREGLTPGFDPTVDRGERLKLDWRGRVTLTAGEVLALDAEHQSERIDNSPVRARMINDGGSVQLQSGLGGIVFDTVSLRYDANDRFGQELTWRAAPALLIAGSGMRLRGSVGTGFKAPTLNELFVSFPQFGFFANPALKPETSFGYDVGFDEEAGRLTFGATYFHNAIRNLITENADFSSLINLGQATTFGIESDFEWRATERLKLRGDYTFTRAEDGLTHQELLRRPEHKASLNARWLARRDLWLSATLLYVGPWVDGSRDFSVPRLNAHGYATLDVAASYALPQGLVLFAKVTNLLDRRYQDPVGFQKPGVGAVAGIKGSF